jgi:FADH2 O2-dependent halogenase
MPHAYAFVDPLFSTGIAWSLRAVERLALAFEDGARCHRVPDADLLARYDATLSAEADQIDLVVAGAYEAMGNFNLFAAQAMLYFGAVSFAEASQRLVPDELAAWKGFLGFGDPVLHPLARESLTRLRAITKERGEGGEEGQRTEFVDWLTKAIETRNVAGLADPNRNNLYPVDFEALVQRHALLGLSRAEMIDALPALRGSAPEPVFPARAGATAEASLENPSLAATPPPTPF